MPKEKNCVICGQPFLSKYGRITCSDQCSMERMRQMWQRANHRRYEGISGQPIARYCQYCGKLFDADGSVVYCSETCRMAKKKEQARLNNELSYKERKKRIKEGECNNGEI